MNPPDPLEVRFVKKYVFPNKAERLLYELASGGKKQRLRSESIRRFANSVRRMVRPERAHAVEYSRGQLLLGGKDILSANAGTPVYIMHFDEARDKTTLRFSEAIDACLGSGPCIMIAPDAAWAFAEAEPGTQEYLFLN